MAANPDVKCVNEMQELSASSFLWEIHSMKDRTRAATYFSDTYPTANKETIKWRLQFYPQGNGYAYFYLNLLETDVDVLNCDIAWSFLAEDGSIIQQLANIQNTFTKCLEPYAFPQIAVNTYIRNDKLILRVELNIKADRLTNSWSQKVKTETKPALPPFSLSEDLLRILIKRESGDLTLVAGGKELLVHKTIVAARSPILAAMIEEKESCDKLVLKDVDFDVVGRVVQYMYTDQVAEIEEMAPQLYPVACKFALLGLKARCEKSMEDSLSVENAVKTLVLAGRYSESLKKKIINFMKTHAEEITTTTNFKSMASSHLQLFFDMFDVIIDEKTGSQPAA